MLIGSEFILDLGSFAGHSKAVYDYINAIINESDLI